MITRIILILIGVICIAVCIPLSVSYFHQWSQDPNHSNGFYPLCLCIVLCAISAVVIFKSIPRLISTTYENLVLMFQRRKLRNRAEHIRIAREAKAAKEAKLRDEQARQDKEARFKAEEERQAKEQARQAEEDAIFDDADIQIKNALQYVDSLGGYLDDEKAANQQLCVALKALTQDKGISINLEPTYRGQKVGDIKIGDTLIEAKLDLYAISEIDRLFGQINRYCQTTPYKIKVVIYGNISQQAIDAIKSSQYYPTRVSLIYLPKPKRKRRE